MKTIILENTTNNSDSLSKKEIVIIDEEKYNKIIEELKDYTKYKIDKNYPETMNILNMSQEEFRRTGYHIEYKNGDLYIYDYSWTYDYPYPAPSLVGHLINPRANLLVFMQELKSSENHDVPLNLKSLIDTNSLEYVNKIYEIAKNAGLSKQEIIEILNELSPQISLFSTDVLDCIKLIDVESVSIEKLKEKIEWCEKVIDSTRNYKKREELENLCKEYRNILYQVDVALGNREVITLSRRINKKI